MALRYGLIENRLTNGDNDCMAITTDNDTIDVHALVEQMIGKGSTVTRAEALSVIEEFEYAVVDAIQKGNNVNTELFRISPSVAGVFNTRDDGYDPGRHTIRIKMNPGRRLNEVANQIELKKVTIKRSQPMLQQFTNLKSHVVNQDFKAGQVVSIQGAMLKYKHDDPRQGIFFIASDGHETRVSNVVKNKPSELQFFVPDHLSAGSFHVEVRVIYHNSRVLKTGRLDAELISLP